MPETVEEHLLAEIADLKAIIERLERGNEYMRKSANDDRNEIILLKMARLFDKVEAVRFLRDGTLPENFRDRVRYFAEDYECTNCDGRLCMDCCSRTMHDVCVEDCPMCCEDGHVISVLEKE